VTASTGALAVAAAERGYRVRGIDMSPLRQLSEGAGMSRTAFTQRFTKAAGRPPTGSGSSSLAEEVRGNPGVVETPGRQVLVADHE
jgi:hypothetical protein